MDIETRDQLDTYLDAARVALANARDALVRSGMPDKNDWIVLGRISLASVTVTETVDSLPTVHSLQAS